MDIIQLLPSHVANQIAAGEVIQRPASVVKEVLENSLDAGSSEITLFIKDSGKTLIQIIDNGSGMSKKDLKLCFKRHATSKIRSADDLFNIHSMGFRGEAMASIAAIAHIEILSKLTKNELGSQLIIEGSEIKKHKDCSTTNGTIIKVKNLFYNVPARRNFLKSDNIEMKHITESFIRFALANPQLKLKMFHNKKELFHLQKSTFRKRIINIFGKRKDEILVPIKEETNVVKITGFVGKPESAKRTRGEQYLFVNGRFIKSPYLQHAINKAFEELIAPKYFPSYFINLTTDPQYIDINIHPTKTEVKFKDEKTIYAILRSTIKRSLGVYNIAPSIDFSQELFLNTNIKTEKNKILKEPTIKVDRTYNPFEKKSFSQKSNKIIDERKIKSFVEMFETNEETNPSTQLDNSYIVTHNKNGLLIIHQRRAHKRILFEYFKNILNNQEKKSQKLLFPKEIKLNNNDLIFLKSLTAELNNIGFTFKIKESSIIINAIPPECQEDNLQYIIEHLIENAKNSEKLKLKKTEQLAKSLAISMAISKTKKLNEQEMNSLKKKLLECEKPSVCPNGKRTMINLKTKDLEKYF